MSDLVGTLIVGFLTHRLIKVHLHFFKIQENCHKEHQLAVLCYLLYCLLSHQVQKSVFRVSHQVGHKSIFAITEAGKKFEISNTPIVLSV